MRQPLIAFLFSLAGPAIWFGFLNLLYGIQTLACTPHAGFAASSAAAGTVTALVLIALVGVAWRQFCRLPDFLARTGLMLTGFSAIASLWTAMPLLLVGACPAGTVA